jgi:hypothetical protein
LIKTIADVPVEIGVLELWTIVSATSEKRRARRRARGVPLPDPGAGAENILLSALVASEKLHLHPHTLRDAFETA